MCIRDRDCIACGTCIDECPSGAISEGEKYSINPDLCTCLLYTSCYTEGPWFMKRGKNYYMLYAAGGVPEHIAYSKMCIRDRYEKTLFEIYNSIVVFDWFLIQY